VTAIAVVGKIPLRNNRSWANMDRSASMGGISPEMASENAPTEFKSNRLGMALLAISSGSADVVAFLLLGQVFASAMTGNAALLGIALSDGNLLKASQPASALLGFAAGAAFASIIDSPAQPALRQSTRVRALLLLEAGCFVGFAILWSTTGHPAESVTHYGLILACSFGMGIQGIAAKCINAPGVNTIVFTSTLVAIISSATQILLRREDTPALRSATIFQVFVFAAYGAGAVIAGLLYWSDFSYLVWLPAAAIIAGFACYEVQLTRSKTEALP
jgi:uncharacterized membrane protein YoaK (UPF0700 family)